MIIGEVVADEIVIELAVFGADERPATLRAIVDTGFTEALTLPAELVSALGLIRVDTIPMILADGSRILCRVYSGTVLWDGDQRPVLIHASDGSALVGMTLLRGSHLTVDVIDGGRLTIEPLT